MFPPRPRPLGKAAPAGGKVQPGGRSVPDAAQKTTVGFNATGLPDDRILFVAQVLVGYKVEVQVKDGTIYEGILHSMRPEGKDVNVVLHWARPVKGPGAASAPPAVKQCVIPSADLVQILAKNVDLSEEELSRPLNGANAFETDSEISKGRGGVERELTRWQPDTSVEEPDMSLNASTFGRPNAGSVTGWDQFETNRQKFQVKSTWDENLYTTKLDKSNAGISVAEAERIAADIERQATRNRHMAEERGIRDNTVQELDEEELYSSVARAVPDEDVAMRPADADNDVTFGADASSDGSKAASNSGRDPADGARKPAWANAGAGVAVVSGRGASWEPPGKVRTAPVAVVDPRKEHNKLRLQMTGGAMLKGKDRSSPSSYGTPKGLRSPLSSPLLGDSIQVEALDLNPGVAKIDRKTRKEFEEFKTKRKEGAGVGDMRSLSHELPSSGGRKPGGEQPPLSSSAGSSSKAGGLVSPSAPSSISSDALPAPPSTSAPPAAAATTPGAAGGQPGQSNGQPPRPPASKSSLNPNAKSFQFNPNAKDFKPTFSAGTTPAGTPFGTPAATPPATPAHSIASAPGAFRQNSFGSSHFGGPGGASQWLGSRSHSGGGPSPHSAGQRKFDRQMERAWGEDGRGGANMDREHGRNGVGGVPPPHGGNQMHPMAASAGLQMPTGSGHMGGPVGVPMGGPPGQWAVPPQFVPGQAFMPMVPGSPQQPQMMTYMGRPYGPPPQGFLVRPGGMPGSPYAGGMMYAPAPPGMHPGGPGGPRPQMFPAPGMMMQGGPGMAPMGMPGPHMGMPGTPGGHPGEQQGGPGPHGSPEQRHRGPGGGHQFHSPTKP